MDERPFDNTPRVDAARTAIDERDGIGTAYRRYLEFQQALRLRRMVEQKMMDALARIVARGQQPDFTDDKGQVLLSVEDMRAAIFALSDAKVAGFGDKK